MWSAIAGIIASAFKSFDRLQEAFWQRSVQAQRITIYACPVAVRGCSGPLRHGTEGCLPAL
jgi:hypothetical protein